MVWIFRERKDSRDSSINPGRCTLKFIAGRTGEDAYVRAYSLAATPLVYYSLFRQTSISNRSAAECGTWT